MTQDAAAKRGGYLENCVPIDYRLLIRKDVGRCGLYESSDDHNADQRFLWEAERIGVLEVCLPDPV